jgi:type I restriction enzyme, S subunit
MIDKARIKKVPDLRFPEFEEEWKMVKLNKLASIERGKFTPRPRNDPAYYGGKTPFVQTSDVVNSNGLITSYSQTLNDRGLTVSKLFKKGTILITIVANIGYAGILQLDMACPVSLIGIICKKERNNRFLNTFLVTQQKRMDYLAPEGAQKNINIEFLAPYQTPVCTLPEQQKSLLFFLQWTIRFSNSPARKNCWSSIRKE